MTPADDQRLSRITTVWTELFRAHGGVGAAQAATLHRYRGAVYRYLCGALRSPDVAEELCQEFALRFVRGDFRRADPEKGRFRDYLKTALIRLVTDYHRDRQAAPHQLAGDTPEAVAPSDATSARDFLREWREGLLDRSWEALGRANAAYAAALRLRVSEPDLPSAAMAERLAGELKREVTPEWVRKALQRAHEKFADLLVEEVAVSLGGAAPAAELEAELRELDLLKYCRDALARRAKR